MQYDLYSSNFVVSSHPTTGLSSSYQVEYEDLQNDFQKVKSNQSNASSYLQDVNPTFHSDNFCYSSDSINDYQSNPLIIAPSAMEVDASNKKNSSKDSLKFCRRLARGFLPFLKNGEDPVISNFLDFASDMLATQAIRLGSSVTHNEGTNNLILSIIQDVWGDFSKQLSCTINKKISKVTKDSWNVIFTHKGFWKCIADQDITLRKQLEKLLQVKDSQIIEAFEFFFKKIVFLTNRGIVSTWLLLYKTCDVTFRKNIDTLDNYIVLTMFPDLYELYNHKRGVFVDNCCGSCKVCQSRAITSSALHRIDYAWNKVISFQKSIFTENIFNTLDIIRRFILEDK